MERTGIAKKTAVRTPRGQPLGKGYIMREIETERKNRKMVDKEIEKNKEERARQPGRHVAPPTRFAGWS